MLHAALALVAVWLPLRAPPPPPLERLVELELVRLPPPAAAPAASAAGVVAPPGVKAASLERRRAREALLAATSGSKGLLALLGASASAPIDGAFLTSPLAGAGAADAFVGLGHGAGGGLDAVGAGGGVIGRGGGSAGLGAGQAGLGELRAGGGEGRLASVGSLADPAPAEILRRLRARAAGCYPRALARLRTEGTAVVKFCVDEAGAVTGPSLATPSGASALDEAALGCVVGGVGSLPVPREGARCLRVPIRFRAAP